MNLQSIFLNVLVLPIAATFLGPNFERSLVAQEQRWTLSPEPVVQIGVAFGDPAYEFHEIEGAARLRNGHIAIADGGSKEIRFFDANGQFLQAVGGEGGGPDEINRIFSFHILGGDTLAVYDSRRLRVVKFDQNGQFLQGVFVEPAGDLPRVNVEHFFADGGMLGIGPEGKRYQPGYWVWDFHLLLYTGNGAYTKYLGFFPGREAFTTVADTPFGRGYSQQLPLFGRQTFLATGPSHFYRIWTGENAISKYSPAGELVEVFSVDHAPQRVTERDVRLEREAFLARDRSPQGTEVLTALLEQLPPPPDSHNVFGWPAGADKGPPLLVDDVGNIWVLEYQAREEGSVEWTVLSDEGEHICNVALPLELRPFHIGDDFVVGWVSGEEDVEYVQMYDLLKRYLSFRNVRARQPNMRMNLAAARATIH